YRLADRSPKAPWLNTWKYSRKRDGCVRKKPYNALGKDATTLALHPRKPAAYSPAVAHMATWFGDRGNEYIDPLSEVY
ncbi:hypothetical protein SB766_23170, partial [Pseudomonas sp. SIMBA_077]